MIMWWPGACRGDTPNDDHRTEHDEDPRLNDKLSYEPPGQPPS